MKKSIMHRQNWILVILGILLTYFSFFLISFIKVNYDGMYAFISISLTAIGLGLVIAGLSIRFNNNDSENAKE